VTTPPSKGLVVELYLIYFGLAQSFVDVKKSCFLFSIIFLIEKIMSQQCRTFTCGSLPTPQCGSEVSVAANYAYTFQTCAKNSEVCPWTALTETVKTVNCTASTATTPKNYPGGSCTDDKECMSTSTCDSNICTGSAVGVVCTTPSQCLRGLACLKNPEEGKTDKVCQPQVVAGGDCTEDYDCKNNLGCYLTKCTAYLSVEDGQVAKNTDGVSSAFSYCKSGYSNATNFCVTRMNNATLGSSCSVDTGCAYKVGEAEAVVEADTCVCGKNINGTSYCQAGNGEPVWKTYFAKLVEMLSDANQVNCHTSERTNCGHIVRSNSMFWQQFINTKNEAELFAELVGIEDCVKNTVYPQFREVASRFCPKYTCDKDLKNSCGMVSTDAIGEKKTVQLNQCTNSTNFRCNINTANVNDNNSFNATCIAKEVPLVARYPGEACTEENDCFVATSSCVNKKCNGTAIGGTCSDDNLCLSGSFCNGVNCTAQLKEKDTCVGVFDCENNFGCYNKTCTKFYSLANGADLTAAMTSQTNPELFCLWGYSSENKCDRFRNTGALTNNLVACDYTNGQKCNYTMESSKKNTTQECGCAMNAEGDSYCPNAVNVDSEWKSYYSNLNKQYANSCHTRSRFTCYDSSKSVMAEARTSTLKTLLGARYYNAPQCVLDIFYADGSANYVFYSALVSVVSIFAIMF
jgi:hypothetical protein